MAFEDETVFTKTQVMALHEISECTIERHLVSHADKLKNNDYRLLLGRKPKEFKGLAYGADIDDGTKTSVSGGAELC